MEHDDPARKAAIEFQIARMDWEGSGSRGIDPNIQLGQGRVGEDSRQDSTHPLAKVVLHPPVLRPALEIATVEDLTGRPVLDPVILKSVQEMDDGRMS